MRLKFIVFFFSLLLLPTYGSGDWEDDEAVFFPANSETSTGGGGPVTTGTVSFLSNYVSRGQTQTFGGPAVQGSITLSQRRNDGAFVTLGGSNIDHTTASNGAGVEIDLNAGYTYKANNDLSLTLELDSSWYPGSYASYPTKDRFDQLEIIPSFTYKYFSLMWSYFLSSVKATNGNFVKNFLYPLPPNGNSSGTWYTEGAFNFPIPGTQEKLQGLLSVGYWNFRHYHILNYVVFTAGASYTLPQYLGGVVLSANVSATTARKKYYTSVNSSGQSKNIVGPKFVIGLTKNF